MHYTGMYLLMNKVEYTNIKITKRETLSNARNKKFRFF